jgi:hypothetical protein
MAKKERVSKKLPVTEIKVEKKKTGRPSIYTKQLAAKICRKIASSTCGLRKMCKENPEFPNVDTILEWRFDYPEFSGQYADAKRQQAELLAEEILDIADDDSQDEVVTEFGVKFNSEFVQRSRLRVDTRKWVACKLMPKVYGDKSDVTLTSIEDETLKETVLELKTALELLKHHERDY